MKKFLMIILSVMLLGKLTVQAQPCLPDGITFDYQYEIDGFPNNYPNCTQVGGPVYIHGENILNLDGLNQIAFIGEDLSIWGTSITSFSGLSNLGTIGGDLIIAGNPLVEDFSGFSALNTINGSLSVLFNENLLSFEGLESITSLSGLGVEGNDSLQDYSGLNNLHSVSGGFSLMNNASLVDFSGLYTLNSVSAGLRIENTGIIDFHGLDSLSIIGGKLTVRNDSSLLNFAGLTNVTSIAGTMEIVSNSSIKNFLGLENLNSIGGNLAISANDSLVSLDGLEGLLGIIGTLSIDKHQELTNINSLSNLFYVGEDIWIYNNKSLKSLEGIDNISAGSIRHLRIFDNDSLETCNVQSVCEYLQAPNGVVTIYSNAQGCNNPSQIADSCGFELLCLPYGSYYVTSQMEVDNFKTNYQGCNELNGALIISGENITNLDSLNEIKKVAGGLSIRSNDSLLNLVGLSLIDSIGGLGIYNNNLLESFHGLGNLTMVFGSVYVRNNPSLISFEGLNNLILADGDLTISNNDLLTDLTPLENLKWIHGELFIWGNDTLESLSGLDNIDEISITNLWITHNPSLSECEVRSICEYISYPNGANINYNYEGCYDYFEVEKACQTVEIKENSFSIDINVFPNPTNTEIYIDKPEEVIIEQVKVYNQLGQLLIKIEHPGNSIDLSQLDKGLFYIELQTNKQAIRKKIIKN